MSYRKINENWLAPKLVFKNRLPIKRKITIVNEIPSTLKYLKRKVRRKSYDKDLFRSQVEKMFIYKEITKAIKTRIVEDQNKLYTRHLSGYFHRLRMRYDYITDGIQNKNRKDGKPMKLSVPEFVIKTRAKKPFVKEVKHLIYYKLNKRLIVSSKSGFIFDKSLYPVKIIHSTYKLLRKLKKKIKYRKLRKLPDNDILFYIGRLFPIITSWIKFLSINHNCFVNIVKPDKEWLKSKLIKGEKMLQNVVSFKKNFLLRFIFNTWYRTNRFMYTNRIVPLLSVSEFNKHIDHKKMAYSHINKLLRRQFRIINKFYLIASRCNMLKSAGSITIGNTKKRGGYASAQTLGSFAGNFLKEKRFEMISIDSFAPNHFRFKAFLRGLSMTCPSKLRLIAARGLPNVFHSKGIRQRKPPRK